MFFLGLRYIPLTRPAFASAPFTLNAVRLLFQSTHLQASKDAQDKNSVKREPNEYCKSGSDDQAAALNHAAFDPSMTRPEEELASAGDETQSKGQDNPLDVSPANSEVSRTPDPQEGGSEGSVTQAGLGSRARSSGGTGGPKSGSGKYSQ